MHGKPLAAEAPPDRRSAAILAASIDDCHRVARDDDDRTHSRIAKEMAWLREAIRLASGTIFSLADDGLMAEFSSSADALRCALHIQAVSTRRMADADRPVRWRIAINAAEIIDNEPIDDAAIDLAARLKQVAPPGGIVLPGSLHDRLRHEIAVPATLVDRPALRGMARSLAVVAILPEASRTPGGGQPNRSVSPVRPVADPRAELALIPFRAAVGGDEAIVLASATCGDVIRRLEGLATWIRVTHAPAAVIRAPIDLQRVRRTSDVRYVLHGAVEIERGMARLSVELNETETGRVLWSLRFIRPVAESAALRAEAVPRIARAIPPLLAQRELDRSALKAEALTAHDLALRAYTLLTRPERETFGYAAALLRQAEAMAPPHGGTRFALVCWHLMAIIQGWTADPDGDARAAGDAAAGLDPKDAAAMALLAYLPSVMHRDHAMACAMLDRVIERTPFCGLAWSLKALALGQMGVGQEAVLHAETADAMPALGPDFAWRDHIMALALYSAGRYAEAARRAEVSAMHHPGLAANARLLAASLAVLGRLDEARKAADRALEIDPGFHIGAWRRRSFFTDDRRELYARRLRLAGLPE